MISKFIWKYKDNENNFEKEKKVEGVNLLKFQTYYKALVIKTGIDKDRSIDQ